MLQQGATAVTTMWQYHDKQHPADQSGMICSGSQLIAFVPMDKQRLPMLDEMLKKDFRPWLFVDEKGLRVEREGPNRGGLFYANENNWQYAECLHDQPVVHIFGAGHVGLALSEVLHFLGFYIHLYDDRAGLNTLEQNRFADEKHVVSYAQIDEVLQSTASDFAVIMTIGYRPDKLLFRQLIRRKWFYLGMLGSDHKIRTLQSELADEGIALSHWENVSAPIGMPIFSKTPQEIAVSIAAEMIREKNRREI